MEDSTILKVVAIASVGAITFGTICINHIDGAVAASMAAIIAGIAGYEVGKKNAEVKTNA